MSVLAAVPARADTATIVSLTFDDGVQDQYDNARPVLDDHGMDGTFYINSARVDAPGYMSLVQLQTLASGGHEIGGHTISHANVPSLPEEEQQRQVCDDRVALLNLGFDVTSFAYPYGAVDDDAEKVVEDCGYNNARTVGGLASPGSCAGCDPAETIPPAEPYSIRSPDSIKTSTTLAQLKQYVTQAEDDGGGWVPLVFHHVCDGCGDAYAVPSATLDAFLDWLQARASGGTVVRTVGEVVGGGVQPPVPGPPSPTEVQNPSLEIASNGVPACFQEGGWGTNTYTWTRTQDARTGQYAHEVEVTSRTSGDRKLVTRQDAGTCAPAAIPGHRYELGVWFKGSWPATVNAKMSIYYRSATGAWVFWTNGPALAETGTWQRSLVTTPPVPAGATNLSFGIALPGAGTLTVDDFTLTDLD
ncbi:polysaccharide deacetylase family protein [Actinomadura algeriensis]|uniref:Peptidoglycan/xylan/chitin deacetylase (PgdA/CDA1 family) n=1 Tax=Actinomadura algeriensis TaxID=1679523 RepID=A0ABR9JK48_9ACTN|nr:polysaccharide deacetylase family protein [Actinomadura algeriensis]MBE1530934.1 peptidoglycan/xylan/chitin deacetylase (PgdA/CDA1 family) [Actinomadura algeriensis]